MTAPKCTSWLGHKFEARYSTMQSPNAASIIEAIRSDRGQTVSTLKFNVPADEVYEGDVCTRCGCIVNRPTPSKEQ